LLYKEKESGRSASEEIDLPLSFEKELNNIYMISI